MEDNILNQIIDRSAKAWGVTYDHALTIMQSKHQKALRINTLKQSKKTTSLLKKEFGLEPISWSSNSYKITKNYNDASKSQLFIDGYFILQDQASFIPVLCLDASANDLILDMCAAPGAKTSHIASITCNKGNIIANDSSKTRLFKMKNLIKQYDVKAELTLYDGRNLIRKFETAKFDKILLDAPCSGEANIIISKPSTYSAWTLAKIKRLSRLQEQLLTVAYSLLKPGGILVYSTCTISPEENEKVVNRLIKRKGAQTLPIDLIIDGMKEGIVNWNDKKYSDQIKRTVRLLPTENHGAFYIAKITKPIIDQNDEFQYKM